MLFLKLTELAFKRLSYGYVHKKTGRIMKLDMSKLIWLVGCN